MAEGKRVTFITHNLFISLSKVIVLTLDHVPRTGREISKLTEAAQVRLINCLDSFNHAT